MESTETYTRKDAILDAIGMACMVPLLWACWVLVCVIEATP